MRLNLPCSLAKAAATALLLLLQQHLMSPSLGFSSVVLPTRTSSSLQRSAAAFTRKSFLAATPTTEESKLQKEFSLPVNGDDNVGVDDLLQKIRAILEKRLKDGTGSLSLNEMEEINTSSSRILVELEKAKEVPPVFTSTPSTTTSSSTHAADYGPTTSGPLTTETATDPMLDDQEGTYYYNTMLGYETRMLFAMLY